MIIAGIDIGNASTETALARYTDGKPEFLSSGIVSTTGMKGTRQNIHGRNTSCLCDQRRLSG